MTHYEKHRAYCRMAEEALLSAWEQAKAMYESTAYFMQLEKNLVPDDLSDADEEVSRIEDAHYPRYEEAKETLKDVEAAMRARDMGDMLDAYWDDKNNPWRRMCDKARKDAEAVR